MFGWGEGLRGTASRGEGRTIRAVSSLQSLLIFLSSPIVPPLLFTYRFHRVVCPCIPPIPVIPPHPRYIPSKRRQRRANKRMRIGANHLFHHAYVVLIQMRVSEVRLVSVIGQKTNHKMSLERLEKVFIFFVRGNVEQSGDVGV